MRRRSAHRRAKRRRQRWGRDTDRARWALLDEMRAGQLVRALKVECLHIWGMPDHWRRFVTPKDCLSAVRLAAKREEERQG